MAEPVVRHSKGHYFAKEETSPVCRAGFYFCVRILAPFHYIERAASGLGLREEPQAMKKTDRGYLQDFDNMERPPVQTIYRDPALL